MAPTSILVLGVGELGNAMLLGLTTHPMRQGVRIAVLLRPSSISSVNGAKQKQIAGFKANDIELVEGDIVQSSVDQLAAIFSHFHTVINCFGMVAPAGTQTKVAKAALSSGCARYFPWQFGVDYDIIGRNSAQDLFTEQLDVRELLRAQSKLQWVIISTGMFTSFVFEPGSGIVNAAKDTVTALGGWENKITTTTPGDIGKVTAEIVMANADVGGVVFVAGDTVSMGQIADVVDIVLGRTVRRVAKTVPELEEELASDPGDGAKKYRIVFGQGVGVAWDKSKTFNARRQINMETVEDWARKNLIR